MKFGFDECRACGKWIWRGDGEELCAPCLALCYGKTNEKQRRRHLFIIACVFITPVVLLVLHLSGKPVKIWVLAWMLVATCVIAFLQHANTRGKPITPAERSDGESRDGAEKQKAGDNRRMPEKEAKGGKIRSFTEMRSRLKELGVDFATWLLFMLVWFGGAGLVFASAVSLLFDDMPTGETVFWSLALLHGAGCLIFVALFVRDINEVWQTVFADRRAASEARRKAEEDLQAEKRAGEDNIAKVKHEHKAELAAVKEEGKKSLAGMQAEIANLQSEKEELGDDLRKTRQTLEYYCARGVLDAYAGEAALRDCGGIYVIKNIGDGKVKIGMTDNFARRFSEIQSHCASAGIRRDDVLPVVLVPLDEGKQGVERAIHRALADRQTAGEWFQVSPEDAVVTVLEHAHERRVANFKRRAKFPTGNGNGGGGENDNRDGDESSIRFGVNWATVTAEDVPNIPLFTVDEDGELCIVKDDEGNTPLHMIAAYGNDRHTIKAVAKALGKAGVEFDPEENNAGKTPLMVAAEREDMEGIDALMSEFSPDSEVVELLYWVAQNARSSEVASYIPDQLSREAWQDRFYDSNMTTPLELAVLSNNTEAADGFIEYDREREMGEVGPITGRLYTKEDSGISYDGEWTRSDGGSILHFAAKEGASREMVGMLLNHVDVNYVDYTGRTPLNYAVSERHGELEDCLREAGGYTCDEVAGECFGIKWKTATPEQVRKVNHNNLGGKFHGAPIHWAARFCPNPAVVDALVESGADVNADSYEVSASDDGNWRRRAENKPIHWAAQEGYPAVIEALVRAGADIDAVNYKDKTPLDIADERADGGAEVKAALTRAAGE